jgi:pyrimidine-nucleoside phosphorylase
MEVTYRLGAWMLVAAGAAADAKEGERKCRDAIRLGLARELFLANVKRQGGQVDRLFEMRGKFRSKFSYDILAPASGYVAGIDAYKIGRAGVSLGVGRDTAADPVYPDAGFVFHKKTGHSVVAGEHICTMYGKDAASLDAAKALAVSAFSFSAAPPQPRPSLIVKEISAL